jgi:hypothetical protein
MRAKDRPQQRLGECRPIYRHWERPPYSHTHVAQKGVDLVPLRSGLGDKLDDTIPVVLATYYAKSICLQSSHGTMA